MEQEQFKIATGIEKEVYSNPYFSYHYGYKNLNEFPKRKETSKLLQIENILFEQFKNINFNILFLNISRKGNFVNFTLNENEQYEQLEKIGIVPIENVRSFSFNLNDVGKQDILHREIFPKPQLNEFKIKTNNILQITKIIDDFKPLFYCVGFDGQSGQLNYNDIHLEIYPHKNYQSTNNFINTLEKYCGSTENFKKYFLDFKKFSHLKIRINNEKISNIKYYRSINVNIPEFYYE